MSVDAFVSYATPDREVTMELVNNLEARGLKCWIAPRDVAGGAKYAEVILKALSEAKVFLLVFSENSNNSEHVQREVERALHASKTIVPVRIADVLPSGSMDYYLATLHWIDAFGKAREGAHEKTAQALAGVVGRDLIDPSPIEDILETASPEVVEKLVSVVPEEFVQKLGVPEADDDDDGDDDGHDDRDDRDDRDDGDDGDFDSDFLCDDLPTERVVRRPDPEPAAVGTPAEAPVASSPTGQQSPFAVAGAEVIADMGGGLRSGSAADSTATWNGSGNKAFGVPKKGIMIGGGALAVVVLGLVGWSLLGPDDDGDSGDTGTAGGDPPKEKFVGEKETPLVPEVDEKSVAVTPPVDSVTIAEPVAKPEDAPVGDNKVAMVDDTKPAVADPATSKPEPVPPKVKDPVPTPPKEMVDPTRKMIDDTVVASRKLWEGDNLAGAIQRWEPVIGLPAAEVPLQTLGEKGVALLRELVVAAAAAADGGEDDVTQFSQIDAWRPLIDFTERLQLDELSPQRERFDLGWRIVEAQSEWQKRQGVEAAQVLAGIHETYGGKVMVQLERSGSGATGMVGRLRRLLDEVAEQAVSGRLGSREVLAEHWQPALKMAAGTGNTAVTATLAAIAWGRADLPGAASFLKDYEVAMRGQEKIDPLVTDVLTEAVAAARSGNEDVTSTEWESAYELAYAQDLPGALKILADVTHSRDPGDAAPLYRKLFDDQIADTALNKRVNFCLEMLERYDLGDQAEFYRAQLQEVFEETLREMDDPTDGGEMIKEVPETRRAADAGVSAAQYIMGDLLSGGDGIEIDPVKAFEYFRRSAKQGYVRARYAVGECYRDGRGVNRDVDEARRIWMEFTDEEAAEVPQALFNLALLTPPGDEQSRLYTAARKHYDAKVAAGKVSKYGSALGKMMIDGVGGDQDAKGGFKLLQKQVEKDSLAQFLVGYILWSEEQRFAEIRKQAGIERDEGKGTELLVKAARSGYPTAIQWCTMNGVKFDGN